MCHTRTVVRLSVAVAIACALVAAMPTGTAWAATGLEGVTVRPSPIVTTSRQGGVVSGGGIVGPNDARGLMAATSTEGAAETGQPAVARAQANDAGNTDSTGMATLTFSDAGITETVAGSGYAIKGTTLTVSAAGTYRLTGSCTDGGIEVKKGTSGVILMLDGLTLASDDTAPIVVKKGSTASIHLVDGTTSTLTSKEDPANETSDDTTVADAFEGACIKVKSGSKVTFCGGGNLVCDATACKNAIKGAATAELAFNGSGTITARAANHGIAADGSLTFNAGTYDIAAGNEGIKSEPDEDDTESAGALAIHGGTFAIDTRSTGGGDAIQANTVTIDGGSMSVAALSDGIQAADALTITGGSITVTTMAGAKTKGPDAGGSDTSWGTFDASTMSAKGLKVATDTTGALTITGGTFVLDCADDAVHSDGSLTVSGGTFAIATGDDGMHADGTLAIGAAGGLARDPDISVTASYEGLEGSTVHIYGGRVRVAAVDDGINAADGSGSQTMPFAGGNCHLYVHGGSIYVDCLGDGLDANGNIVLTGGTLSVFSAAGGSDNSPFDCDGSWTINGATLFGAGSAGMSAAPANGSQAYTVVGGMGGRPGGTGGGFGGFGGPGWPGGGPGGPGGVQPGGGAGGTTYAAGSVIGVMDGDATLYVDTLLRSANYLVYSSPAATATVSFATGASPSCDKGNDWTHSWDGGIVSVAATATATGVRTYTCTTCGKTEDETIPALASAAATACDHTVAQVEKVDIAQASISGIPVQEYTGTALTPKPTVALGGLTLTEGSDYTLGYANNVRPGKATVSVTGIGAYTGTVSVTFEITNATLTMHRLYNPNSGEHFYTGNVDEKNELVSIGWNYEGIGWTAPATSETPVWRLYNPNAGDHHYTTDDAERTHLVSVGWQDEGIGWYSDDAQAQAVYREYNPNARSGNHNYTPDSLEHNMLVLLGWHDEGVGWYGVTG